MRIETEKIYKLVKKYGGVLTDDLHFMNDVDELLETAHNSDYAKCEHDFEPRKTWVHTCRKCGIVQIEKGHFA